MDEDKKKDKKDKKDIKKYMKHYSDSGLFKKIIKVAKKAGIKIIYIALLLYYTLKKPSTPKWAKTTIIAALGYFIAPIDAIPDFIAVAGYSDDLGVLLLALGSVLMHIDQEVKNQAKMKLVDWFGDYDDKAINDIDEKVDKDDKKNKEDKED